MKSTPFLIYLLLSTYIYISATQQLFSIEWPPSSLSSILATHVHAIVNTYTQGITLCCKLDDIAPVCMPTSDGGRVELRLTSLIPGDHVLYVYKEGEEKGEEAVFRVTEDMVLALSWEKAVRDNDDAACSRAVQQLIEHKEWKEALALLEYMPSDSTCFSATDVSKEMVSKAEFVYQNQKEERYLMSSILRPLAVFPAEWPCMWGEEVVVDLPYVLTPAPGMPQDGWKYTCGLTRITSPCIVYSLGSMGNMAFEKDLLRMNPACVIHIYDQDDYEYEVENFFPDAGVRSTHVFFHRAFIGPVDDLTRDPPMLTIETIMANNGHSHIDILKMDIEGSEWHILTKKNLPSIGQLLVELHATFLPVMYGIDRSMSETQVLRYTEDLFNNLESQGLRLFHREINLYDVKCIELSFIQYDWHPHKKNYTRNNKEIL